MCNNEEWQRRKKLPLWILGMNYKKFIRCSPDCRGCTLFIYNNVLFLVNQYHEILACAPEELRVGDAENILLVGITLKGVAG